MADILNNPQDGIQGNDNTQQGQESTNVQQSAQEVVSREQYINLQGDYTKRVESEISLASKLVEKDASELKNIEDSRVRNAVAKRLYGMDYNQLIAVYGENFTPQSTGDENLDKTAQLEREVKLLKFNRDNDALDVAINSFVSQNKALFPDDASIDKLKDELKYISSEVPVSERVKRAANFAFGVLPNDTSAYNAIVQKTLVSGGNVSMQSLGKEDEAVNREVEAGMKLLGLK